MDDPKWWRQNKGILPEEDSHLRDQYTGFTDEELTHLKAIPSDLPWKVQPNNLKGIHPVFAQDNWEKVVPAQYATKPKPYALGKDHKGRLQDGDWTGHNPLVWRALEPSLKLTSKFVENAHMFPWFDALVHGVKKRGRPQSNDPKTFLTFYYRPEKDFNSPESRKATQEFMLKIAKNISFGISESHVDPRTGEYYAPGERCYTFSLPAWEDDEGKSRIWIADQVIMPLMQDYLSEERVMVYVVRQGLRLRPELRCEDDTLFEPGSSFEMATFGGQQWLLGNNAGFPSLIRSILEGWQGIKGFPERPFLVSPTITDEDGSTTSQYRPIPFVYVEDLSREEFWKYFVKKFGAEALRIYPVTEGRIVRRKNGQLQGWKFLGPPKEQPEWLRDTRTKVDWDIASPNMDDQIAYKIATERILRAKKIAQVIKAEKQDAIQRAKVQEGNPEIVHRKRLQAQKNLLHRHMYQCRDGAEKITRMQVDYSGKEFETVRKMLIDENKRDRQKIMEWIAVAEDEEVAGAYQEIFDKYEKIKTLCQPIDQQLTNSGNDTFPKRSSEAWVNMIKQARDLLSSNEIPESVAICKDVVDSLDAPNRSVAEAYLLLAKTDGQDQAMNAKEAVQIFELIKRYGGSEFDHRIKKKLDEALLLLRQAEEKQVKKRLKVAHAAKTKVAISTANSQPVPKEAMAEIISKPEVSAPGKPSPSRMGSTKPKLAEDLAHLIPLPLNLAKTGQTHTPQTAAGPANTEKGWGSKPHGEKFLQTIKSSQIPLPKPMPQAMGPKTVEHLPKPSFPNPIEKPKALAGMTPKTRLESQREIYNEACEARRASDIITSERILLTLLKMKTLNDYLKAMCHIQLATMSHRTDRVDQARRAQLLFMQLEQVDPSSERVVTDRRMADRLMLSIEKEEQARAEQVAGKAGAQSVGTSWERASTGILEGLRSLFSSKRKRRDGEDRGTAGGQHSAEAFFMQPFAETDVEGVSKKVRFS